MDGKLHQSAQAVCKYLEKLGYKTVEPSYYTIIQNWMDWYMNGVDEFHKSTFFNGINVIEVDIKSLGMAKTVCETWGNLMMNEKVQIDVGNEAKKSAISKVLEDNAFYMNANHLCELYCALGSGAFVEYLEYGEIKIDFIKASMIYPLSWDSTGIHECAFASRKHDKNNGDYLYIQLHVLNERGTYVIVNRMIQVENGQFKELELPEDLDDMYETGSEIPLFQILKPNIVNNVDLENPMGISVYANAIDCLKEIDTTFNALNVEIDTGRRMVFLSQEMFMIDKDGNQRNVIGQNETILRWMGGDNQSEYIKDFSPTFRTAELKETLQFQLNLLSEKTGMGTNQFEFTSGGVKTATEVISEDSDLYTTLKKHEIVLEKALKGLLMAISYLAGIKLELDEININFDDSIIEDKDTERKQDQTDLANGTYRPEEYRAKWRNEDLDTALKNLPAEADVMP